MKKVFGALAIISLAVVSCKKAETVDTNIVDSAAAKVDSLSKEVDTAVAKVDSATAKVDSAKAEVKEQLSLHSEAFFISFW